MFSKFPHMWRGQIDLFIFFMNQNGNAFSSGFAVIFLACLLSVRFLICCDSCRKWHHTDCVGISEAHGRLFQKNGEQFTCSTCSDDDNITRKIRNPNKISTCTAVKLNIFTL